MAPPLDPNVVIFAAFMRGLLPGQRNDNPRVVRRINNLARQRFARQA